MQVHLRLWKKNSFFLCRPFSLACLLELFCPKKEGKAGGRQEKGGSKKQKRGNCTSSLLSHVLSCRQAGKNFYYFGGAKFSLFIFCPFLFLCVRGFSPHPNFFLRGGQRKTKIKVYYAFLKNCFLAGIEREKLPLEGLPPTFFSYSLNIKVKQRDKLQTERECTQKVPGQASSRWWP